VKTKRSIIADAVKESGKDYLSTGFWFNLVPKVRKNAQKARQEIDELNEEAS